MNRSSAPPAARAAPIWVPPPERPEPQACGDGALPPLAAAVLARRGIAADDAFLRPRLHDLADPFLLAGARAAAERLLAAVDARQRVTLCGDYDVDGVSSLALLSGALEAYGCKPAVFLPHRMEEGYGLSPEAIERCRDETSPELVVAVDCGTTAVAEAALLRRQGIDLVVLDHHEPPAGGLPGCVALVNPKVCGHLPYLCAAGVVFKVVHAMLKLRPLAKETYDLKSQLDLVALATVADIVPLLGENRIFVRHGLAEIARGRRPGLQALKAVARLNGNVRAPDIGFRLGPRLNAAGRLDSALHAFRLLVASEPGEAGELADLLDLQNRERQEVEQAIVREAMLQAAAAAAAGDLVIVLGGDGWHPGVLGIVSARVTRHFHRPSVVIGFDESGHGKGSARSVPGISLVAAIDACRAHIERGGGHDMAAGLSLSRTRFPAFKEAMAAAVAAQAEARHFQPLIEPDALARLAELDAPLLAAWELLMPFGTGFPEPLLLARALEAAWPPRLLKDKHYKFRFRQDGAECDAIWFNAAAEAPLPPPPWDVAFALENNEWHGRSTPQMRVVALRAATQP
jgi:single-stranded-DNA-specific exonuclease